MLKNVNFQIIIWNFWKFVLPLHSETSKGVTEADTATGETQCKYTENVTLAQISEMISKGSKEVNFNRKKQWKQRKDSRISRR